MATEVRSFSCCSGPRPQQDDDDDVEVLSNAPTTSPALPGSISGWQTAAAAFIFLACWWWWQ